MNLAGGLAFSENVLYYIGGIILLVISFVLGTVADFSLYLIYDNDGKVFKSIYKVFVYLIKGGIIKVTVLMFSFIFWWIGVIISAGMLTFFVYPYMEVSRAVLYEDVYNLLRSDK